MGGADGPPRGVISADAGKAMRQPLCNMRFSMILCEGHLHKTSPSFHPSRRQNQAKSDLETDLKTCKVSRCRVVA